MVQATSQKGDTFPHLRTGLSKDSWRSILQDDTPKQAEHDLIFARAMVGLDGKIEPMYEMHVAEDGKMVKAVANLTGFARMNEKSETIIRAGAGGRSFFAAFKEVYEHLGGKDGIKDKTVIELGAGTETRFLRPAMALMDAGAKVSIVDGSYPADIGPLKKSGFKDYLERLPDSSVDAFMAFRSLEHGSMGVKPGDVMLARADPKVFLQTRTSSTDSPEYIEDIYRLMAKKLKPDGIAVVLNSYEKAAPSRHRLEDLGFRMEKTGRDPNDSEGSQVLWVMKPKHQ